MQTCDGELSRRDGMRVLYESCVGDVCVCWVVCQSVCVCVSDSAAVQWWRRWTVQRLECC